MNKLVLIAGGSALVYAGLALLMGVLPGIELSRTPAGPGVEPLTPLQAEGRDVYVANGCGYCHTQQVRPLPQDKIFGRPSAPGDFAFQTPELLGSERTGPDLTNAGVRQPSTVWQFIHLYNPRAVVPESIMPGFDWMFKVVEQAPAGTAPVPLPRRTRQCAVSSCLTVGPRHWLPICSRSSSPHCPIWTAMTAAAQCLASAACRPPPR